MKKFLSIACLSLSLVACAVDQSVGRSDYETGVKYLQGIGVEKNAVKAVEYLLKAGDAGNADALLTLGYLYLKGTGVIKDEAKAFGLFLRAAKQGNPDGEYNAGLAYVKGLGTKSDFNEAFGWFLKAAKQGDIGSSYNLGVMYLNGEGVVRDALASYAWFKQAAAGGYEGAREGMRQAKDELSGDQLKELDSVVAAIEKGIKKPVVTATSEGKEQPL